VKDTVVIVLYLFAAFMNVGEKIYALTSGIAPKYWQCTLDDGHSKGRNILGQCEYIFKSYYVVIQMVLLYII
jgi:hypothetical protein